MEGAVFFNSLGCLVQLAGTSRPHAAEATLRYLVRTHRANHRGGGRNRTAVRGFAGPCLNHSATPPGVR